MSNKNQCMELSYYEMNFENQNKSNGLFNTIHIDFDKNDEYVLEHVHPSLLLQ